MGEAHRESPLRHGASGWRGGEDPCFFHDCLDGILSITTRCEVVHQSVASCYSPERLESSEALCAQLHAKTVDVGAQRIPRIRTGLANRTAAPGTPTRNRQDPTVGSYRKFWIGMSKDGR